MVLVDFIIIRNNEQVMCSKQDSIHTITVQENLEISVLISDQG